MRTVCSPFSACWLMAMNVCGQGRFTLNGGQPGQIAFGNYIPNWGIEPSVFDVDCQTRLEGPRFVSEVYAGFAPDQLEPLGLVVPFKSELPPATSSAGSMMFQGRTVAPSSTRSFGPGIRTQGQRMKPPWLPAESMGRQTLSQCAWSIRPDRRTGRSAFKASVWFQSVRP